MTRGEEDLLPVLPPIRLGYPADAGPEIAVAVERVVKSGWLSGGKEKPRFEEAFARWQGVEHAVSTNSCTSGLWLALKAEFGRWAGRMPAVIVPVNTYVATHLAVYHAGLPIVWADVDPGTMCLGPDQLLDAVRRANESGQHVGAVVVVHNGGVITPEMPQLVELCRANSWFLLEDCAHAHGCSLKGVPAGAWGDAGSFSFSPTKVLPIGEGGMVTTKRADLALVMRELSDYGRDLSLDGPVRRYGHSLRMSEFTAAVGNVVMKHATDMVAGRRRMAEVYDEVEWPEGLRHDAPAGTSSYYKYILKCPVGMAVPLYDEVRKAGVILGSRVYDLPICDHPVFDHYPKPDLPNARAIADGHVCLNVYADGTADEARRVASAVLNAYGALT